MGDWATLRDEAPELAELAERRLAATGLMMLASIRSDGYPRISPLEPIIHDDRLYLGMMPESTKALDLRREPRCALHTATADKDLTDGDVKMWGLACEVIEPAELASYGAALEAQLGHHFDQADEINVFTLELEGVSGAQIVDDAMRITTWKPGGPPRVDLKR